MAELERVAEHLEVRGYRITAPRLAVLSAMVETPDPFAGEEIRRRLPAVGRATVFRTLKLLLEMDLLCRVALEDGRFLYSWSQAGHHHHMVCNSCGAVTEISGCDVAGLLDGAAGAVGFSIEGHRLEIYGRCRACSDRHVRRDLWLQRSRR